MRLTRNGIIIAVMGSIIAVLLWALVYFARDELAFTAEHGEEEIPTPSAVSSKNGHASIELSAQSQKASGIGVAALVPADNQGSIQIYGTVINPQPLFELRAQYLAAQAEARAQQVAIANSDNDYQRLRRLNADDRNVSERAVLEAHTRWRGDQAKLAAAEQSVNALRAGLRASWGDTVAAWAADPDSSVFRNLSAQREVLVQVVIPFEMQEWAAKRPLAVTPVGVSEAVRPARYVGPAQVADSGMSGATYLFLANATDLRQGMRIEGRLQLESQAREGVLIPEAAVVWHGGKAWCYVQDEPDEFIRKEVDTSQELPGGWFNKDGFEAGEKVVIRGAQLLLSEEQKFQIREENGD